MTISISISSQNFRNWMHPQGVHPKLAMADQMKAVISQFLRLHPICTKQGSAEYKENPETVAVSGFLKFLMRSRLSLGVLAY